ncbi:MAG: hypothetical protein PWP07_559 [Epulopiscium sp.]|nr:hypothetical protein [Candidatus Epulonipiscium sp.]
MTLISLSVTLYKHIVIFVIVACTVPPDKLFGVFGEIGGLLF